eukprot:4298255-Ditylum_brightwellii.AAC.1
MKAFMLLWVMYQTCKSLGYQCTLVKRCITVKKKGCHPEDGTMAKAERKYVPLPLVGPLNFLSHACTKHYNMAWECVSGKRYKCTLKRVVKKCGQMLISHYFNEEDVEGDKSN